jgi:spermidine synthase
MIIFSAYLYYHLNHDIKILAVTDSNYGKIFVYEKDQKRCISSKHPNKATLLLTCIFVEKPIIPAFSYYKLILGSLYINPNPQNILMIGLGGGGLVNTLSFILPNSHIDMVEINPKMVEVSKKFFHLKETEHIKVFMEDGVEYIRNVSNNHIKYDLIILDAFVDYKIPQQFVNLEFMKLLKNILSSNGVVAINIMHSEDLALESKLFAQIFGNFYNLTEDLNHVLITTNLELPTIEKIHQEANMMENILKSLEIDKKWLTEKFILSLNPSR